MLETLLQLQDTVDLDDLIDYIFKEVNDLLLKGSYGEIDKLLQGLLPRLEDYTPDVALSFLTITLTAYNLLPTRAGFYKSG